MQIAANNLLLMEAWIRNANKAITLNLQWLPICNSHGQPQFIGKSLQIGAQNQIKHTFLSIVGYDARVARSQKNVF